MTRIVHCLDCARLHAWHGMFTNKHGHGLYINMQSKRMGRIGPETKTKLKNRGCFLSSLDLLATLLCSDPIFFSFSSAREQGNRPPDLNMS